MCTYENGDEIVFSWQTQSSCSEREERKREKGSVRKIGKENIALN